MLHKIELATGQINTDEERVLRNVRGAIRRQLPQVRPYQEQPITIALIGGGPSLSDTTDELREVIFTGAKVACVNGAYQWAIDHNIKPDLAIALDARPENAHFFKTPVPGCKYLLASQCAPEMFDAVDGRDVSVWHGCTYGASERAILEAYYTKDHFWPITGGSTVMLRGIAVIRMLGFRRMEVFGFDSCWMEGRHHAYPQALNDRDKCIRVVAKQDGAEGSGQVFYCAPWHMKQAEDFQLLVQHHGKHFELNVHGDGLIAHMIKEGASFEPQEIPESERRFSSNPYSDGGPEPRNLAGGADRVRSPGQECEHDDQEGAVSPDGDLAAVQEQPAAHVGATR